VPHTISFLAAVNVPNRVISEGVFVGKWSKDVVYTYSTG